MGPCQLLAVHGMGAAADIWEAFLQATRPARIQDALLVLAAIASEDPTAANAWLVDGLVTGAIQGDGLESDYVASGDAGLMVSDEPWVTGIPVCGPLKHGLMLKACPLVQHLPEGFGRSGTNKGHYLISGGHADGPYSDLVLEDCPGIQVLPKGLQLKDVAILNCDALVALPEDMEVGCLTLRSCAALAVVPDGIRVDDEFHVNGCQSLVHLPEALRVGGGFWLSRCSALERLPEGLDVRGVLHIQGCASLRSLPSHLTVCGDLIIEDCPAWDGIIPEGAVIHGVVMVDGGR